MQLKTYIEDEVKAVHDRISAQVRDTQLGMKASMDLLARSVQELKETIR